MSIPQPFVFSPGSTAPITWGPVVAGYSLKLATRVLCLDLVATATIVDPNGNPVTSAQNLTMVQVASAAGTPSTTSGIYQAIVPFTFDPINPATSETWFGPGFLTVINGISAALNGQRQWEIPTIVKYIDNL